MITQISCYSPNKKSLYSFKANKKGMNLAELTNAIDKFESQLSDELKTQKDQTTFLKTLSKLIDDNFSNLNGKTISRIIDISLNNILTKNFDARLKRISNLSPDEIRKTHEWVEGQKTQLIEDELKARPKKEHPKDDGFGFGLEN